LGECISYVSSIRKIIDFDDRNARTLSSGQCSRYHPSPSSLGSEDAARKVQLEVTLLRSSNDV
jgi:hypothetical protein